MPFLPVHVCRFSESSLVVFSFIPIQVPCIHQTTTTVCHALGWHPSQRLSRASLLSNSHPSESDLFPPPPLSWRLLLRGSGPVNRCERGLRKQKVKENMSKAKRINF